MCERRSPPAINSGSRQNEWKGRMNKECAQTKQGRRRKNGGKRARGKNGPDSVGRRFRRCQQRSKSARRPIDGETIDNAGRCASLRPAYRASRAGACQEAEIRLANCLLRIGVVCVDLAAPPCAAAFVYSVTGFGRIRRFSTYRSLFAPQRSKWKSLAFSELSTRSPFFLSVLAKPTHPMTALPSQPTMERNPAPRLPARSIKLIDFAGSVGIASESVRHSTPGVIDELRREADEQVFIAVSCRGRLSSGSPARRKLDGRPASAQLSV